MDWQQRLNRALTYIEDHLESSLSLDEAAQQANSSSFAFFRMFEVITGLSPGEYVRRRRLSLAALELVRDDAKIIDVALRFGYESPESFTKAFRRLFSLSPSEAKKPGVTLATYPPMRFTVVLQGVHAMNFRIEQTSALELTGLATEVTHKDGMNYKIIPDFWDAHAKNGNLDRLCAWASPLGSFGICVDFQPQGESFTYLIAIERPGKGHKPKTEIALPSGMKQITIPPSVMGKFEVRGPLPQSIQETWKRIWGEWFPTSGYEHAGTAELEVYPSCSTVPPHSPDYRCEIWIPLRKVTG